MLGHFQAAVHGARWLSPDRLPQRPAAARRGPAASVEEKGGNVVRAPDFSAATEQALLSEFRTVFGPGINIRAEYVERIPQEHSGKYRFSICRV